MTELTLSAVAKAYGRKSVLAGVDATFPAGLTLLVGPSGAGKSTLLRIIATAEKPQSGTICWNGAPMPGARQTLRQVLGYAPQAVELPEELTAREFALHIAALKGLDTAEADQQFGAITAAIGLHDDINRRIAGYSGGMRRRLIFAQALLGDPQLIALDEPTAELDHESAAAVSALLLERARRAVVVMTTHLADQLASQAVQVLRIADGKASKA